MTVPLWPVDVPYEVLTGWQMVQPWLKPIVTEMEGGNQRIRRRPGDDIAIMTYPLMPLNYEQFDVLMTFFRSVLKNGASRFLMPVWTGSSYQTKTVQFEGGEPPSATEYTAGFVAVVMKLRVYGM